MKKLIIGIISILALSFAGQEIAKISTQNLYPENRDATYARGDYLIILANSALSNYLINPTENPYFGDNFVEYKRTQGFDVDVISLNEMELTTSNEIRTFLQGYYSEHPMLEYVLLVGDVNGNFVIPTFFIHSINEDEEDVTDYPYTYFDDENLLSPHYFIGRWSVRNFGDLINIKLRTIEYTKMTNITEVGEADYLNRALLVAGNYKNNDGIPVPPETWPVTPVWTSYWLMDRLDDYGYTQIDTAFFHADYQVEDNPLIINAWNDGVGIINYRGWGNSHGWHYPHFHIDNINELHNSWKLPIVMSFVCNTGDFGADISPQTGPSKCFGEELITMGTPASPKGAVAVVAPSDLDTDTRFNNVMCGVMWDNILDESITELAPALHSGKQSLINEFGNLEVNGTNVTNFYHHIYGVLGDPSLPIRLHEPNEISVDYISNDLHNSFIFVEVFDGVESNPIVGAVGALMLDGELIGKALTNIFGDLLIDFDGIPDGSILDLYINSPQFYQKHMTFNYIEDNGEQCGEGDVFLDFDVSPTLSTGENYISSNENISISLEIFNHYPEVHEITVSIIDFMDVMTNYNSYPQTISIDALSSNLTSTIFEGTLDGFAIGSRVYFGVQFDLEGDQVGGNVLEFVVGPIETTDPTSPSDYGYIAFDNTDVNYLEAPTYDWIELNPANGGQGTDIGLVDDSHTQIEFGFDFTYYGQSYNTATVCSNGWLAFEPSSIDYFWNFSIPFPIGPSAMVAPYMDDLDDNGGTEPFEVFAWNDVENGRFVIQWDNVSNGEDDEYCPNCIKETFEVIFYDPAIHQTETGDGEILFQYQEIHDIDANGNFSTIGIESPNQSTGLQYLFNEQLAPGASPLTDGLAIKFTTDPAELQASIDDSLFPTEFGIIESYPNPFNPSTVISYQLMVNSEVRLDIYNLAGQLVETLVDNKHQFNGYHEVNWNASEYPSGIYFARLSTPTINSIQKMTLIK
jgi:hypothetical protein